MPDTLPSGLRPPALAMAKAVNRIPPPNALPGGCLYEPKWDGFIHWTSQPTPAVLQQPVCFSQPYSDDMPPADELISPGPPAGWCSARTDALRAQVRRI
jgi:hypothetical protein